ncbi:hypothetical protein FDP41_006131 [Naegleria fowleri]|uniref:Uncharacterized protein n=1 Tax=Naegleria fowleri TaxID=5763 RepID=A0A6A5BC34_NAEFO|nr:uncharacterized protein FDP41_006131 [Naegleria fowleri]KAF0974657.1 hypothetical protein FDP41_006131 [Naegleria fowleri]
MFTPPTPSSENHDSSSSSDSISITLRVSSPIPLNRSPSSSFTRNSPPATPSLSRVNSILQEKSSCQTTNNNNSVENSNNSSGGKRKKTLLKASLLISPLLLPQHSHALSNHLLTCQSSTTTSHSENSNTTTVSHHHGSSVFGNYPTGVGSSSSSLQESHSSDHSVMSEFSAWEEVFLHQHVMMTSGSSSGGEGTNSSSSSPVTSTSSPLFDDSFNNNSDQDHHSSKRSNLGKSRKLTTFISKIFGINLSTDAKTNHSPTGTSSSNRSKTIRLFNSGAETDEFFKDSAIEALENNSSIPSSSSSPLHKSSQNSSSATSGNSNTQQQRTYQMDLESRQKSNFNQWFQDKSQTVAAQHLFEKEGCVYFFKKEIKPQIGSKKSSSLSYLSSPFNSGQGNNVSGESGSSYHALSSSGDLGVEEFQSNDIFVERFMSCKNEVVTIFEKSTKDSPVKHTFSWNQNVTYSIIPTERSFDTVILKQQKRKVRYYKNQYYLFEIRVEQGDYLYVMEPLILVGLVKTKEERDDWTDLFEIYSIYSSLNVFTEDEFTLASTLTREDKLRDRLIQEYELFNEYQNEVREGVNTSSQQSSLKQSSQQQQETLQNIDIDNKPRLSIIDNPFEESKAFQKEMEKSYSHLIQSFGKNYLNSFRMLPSIPQEQ